MKVLVACEESQEVCKAFRAKGHEAYSCDIQECSGGHPEWHIQGDVLPLLNGNCDFKTVNGDMYHLIGKWDMIIAFPPCTHLAVSGAAWFEKKRADGRQAEAIEFFCKFLEADCEKVAIENPIGIISGDYVSKWFPSLTEKYDLPKKPTQIIHPYMFGHPVSKATCLWLRNLPKLKATNIIKPEWQTDKSKGKRYSGATWYATDENGKIISWNDPRTAKIISKTFPGIAKAMASQWG